MNRNIDMNKTRKKLSKLPISLTIIITIIWVSIFFYPEKIYGYGDNISPRIDMLSLLDAKIRTTQQEDENILLLSPFENKTIVVPENIYNQSELNIFIPVSAESTSTSNDTITFVGCLNETFCPDENSVYSNTVLIPGTDFVNISSFLSQTQNPIEIYLKGIINAIFNNDSVTYERITSPSETIRLTLQKITTNEDNDLNGLPENFNNIIDAGEIWYSNQLMNGSLRNVILLPLNLEDNTVKIKLAEDIILELPTYQSFLDQNLLVSESSLPFAIISLTDNYDALIDITSGTTLQNWLENISQTAPGILLPELPLLSVFLLQKTESGDIQPISLENSTLSIKSHFSVSINQELQPVGVFTYPTKMFGQYFTNDNGTPNIWKKTSHTIDEGNIEVSFKGNCILATFQLLLKINTVSPSRIPVNTPTPLTLSGVIPVSTPQTVENAETLYEVKISGIKAEFRNGGSDEEDIAITQYIEDGENQMYITSPSISTPGKVDVEVIDKSVAGYSYLLPQAIQVLNVYTITANISRSFPDISPNAKITLSPTNSPELDEPNKFFEGDNVILTISGLDPDTSFVGWYSSTGTLISTQTSVLITIQSNTTITAKITKNQNYKLTINVDPPNSGTVNIDPQMDEYPAGSVITLTAIPAGNYMFDKWQISSDITDITSTQNPLTLVIDKDYEITAIFKEKPIQVEKLLPFEHAELVSDEQGNQRLAVWVFGGVVCEIQGMNLNTNMTLQLIDATTKETLISEINPVECSSDGSTAKIIVPQYPNYSDDMPAYIDTDLKYENTIIPAFRYYHYKTDTNGITYTAFLINLTSPEKVTIHLESVQKKGELQLPPIANPAVATVAGIIRTMVLTLNPTASASASLFGNTLINGGIYGAPIAGIYEISLHLYQPISKIDTYTPGKPTYEIAKDSNGNLLLIKDKYPYKTDGTPDSQIVPIRITLPANDLDYNYFRDGLSVFGQLVYFDYISNQVIPKKFTCFQSQLLADDIDPKLTETSQGPAESYTIRAYSLNSFGIRKGSLLPFQTTSLIRLTAENGVLISPKEGKVEGTIVSPQGGLAYVDRIVIKNPNTGSQLSIAVKDERGVDEGKLKFKTPPSSESGIMDILLYTRGNPSIPVAVLSNTLIYPEEPVSLDYLWLIPTGLSFIIFGALGGGIDGGGPCFIATAVYGTPLAKEINVLRAIRDQYMLTNPIGTAFVEFYYSISPPIAEFIAHHPSIAIPVRIILTILVTVGRILLISPYLTKLICLTLLAYLITKKIIKAITTIPNRN